MHLPTLTLALLPLVSAFKIVVSNDDGWAESNIRTFYSVLRSAGENAFISAPAENQSGSGSSNATAKPRTQPCEFNSCPANSPAVGHNASDPRLNYVNSYPVSSIEYGINTLANKLVGGKPDIAVAGPNVGGNIGIQVPFSGTVGATVAAVNLGIPGIAFSGSSGDPTAWNAPTPHYSTVYADLALNITETILASGAPYLPAGVWLNVNFPVSDASTCSSPGDFKFVLSRIYTGVLSAKDVTTCGSDRLPTELAVMSADGCYASISIGDASDKTDADAARQAVVLKKLGKILSCLP